MKWLLFLGALLALSLVPAEISLAAPKTPAEVLEEMFTRLKTEKRKEIILEYVDWENVLSKTPQDKVSAMGIKSAQQLRDYYINLARDPIAVFRQNLEQRRDSLPPEKQAQIEEYLKRLEADFAKREETFRKEIEAATFHIDSVEIKDGRATTTVTSTIGERTKTDTMDMLKHGDTWLLEGPKMPGAGEQRPSPQTAPQTPSE